jgi:hypothetical protein
MFVTCTQHIIHIRKNTVLMINDSHYLPVYFATPLNVISSIIVGSDRPLAFAANNIILYELPGSKSSMKNDTGGR